MTPTQGVDDLQPNRRHVAVRVLVWSLAGLVLLLAVVLGATAVTLPGCSACHDSKAFVTQTQQSAHASIACARCHVQPGAAQRVVYAYHLVFGMTLRVAPTGSGPVAGIPDTTCLSCHQVVMTKIITAKGLTIDHAKCSKGRLCTDCHSETAHGTALAWPRTFDMDTCLDCHTNDTCDTCHKGKSTQQRLATGAWSVTHGPEWKQTHGMGDLKTCAACHTASECESCHGIPLPHDDTYIRDHPAEAATNRKDCAVCHKQAFCDDCHGLAMPHPASFTQGHAAIVKKQGQTLCMRCHVQDDCDKCHVAHVHPGGATLPPAGSGAK
jgi:hypothetical protein